MSAFGAGPPPATSPRGAGAAVLRPGLEHSPDVLAMPDSDGFNVLVWEDDDTACTIKNDKDNIKGAIETTRLPRFA